LEDGTPDPEEGGSDVQVVLNHRDLCTGQIVGISMGVLGATAILAAAAVAVMVGGVPAGGSYSSI
jgi:hypothetical protein